jgi:hypothetical protein
MGAFSTKTGLAVEASQHAVFLEDLYVEVREALRKVTAPKDAAVACAVLKHFFREVAKLPADGLEQAEFLDSLEKLLKAIEAKACLGPGGEEREEGLEMLQGAIAKMEELRETYLDCKGCSWVIQDTVGNCSEKARYPPFQACMQQERERRRAIAECGASPHLFDRGFSIAGLAGGQKLQEVDRCLAERGVLPRGRRT